MTAIKFYRQSLELTDAEWRALATIAAATESLAPTGQNSKQPSWRSLIKRIADGELVIHSCLDAFDPISD